MLVTYKTKRYMPREEVRGETPLQESGRAHRLLLAREELKARRRVRIVEMRLLMHPPDDQETTVEDTRRRGVPPRLDEDEIRVLKYCAPLSGRRRAGLEEPDRLVPGLDGWVAGEARLVPPNARLG